MKKRLFRVFSFVLACVLLFMCFTVPAYAIDFPSARVQRFKAMIASAITAINIGLSASQATASDLYNYLVDPLEIVYTYGEEASDQYWDQQVIHMYKDYTTIDGVPYTDIWLSHDIADRFRVDAFDFKTGYNIASNSNGTFASGAGSVARVPVYYLNNVYRSQEYTVPKVPGTYAIGDMTFQVVDDWSTDFPFHIDGFYNGSRVVETTDTLSSASSPFRVIFNASGNSVHITSPDGSVSVFSSRGSRTGTIRNGALDAPFDFDYVSGTIPADEALPQDTGLMLRVPSSSVNEWMDDNPNETDVDWEIDIDSPDVMSKLNDLFNLIVPIIPIIEADFSEQHIAPVPPAPGETISDTDYTILDTTLQDIRESIEAIPGAIQQIISSIPTKLDTLIESLGNIGNTILEEIQEGPIRLARKAIDVIKSIFLPILISLKNAIGIWHYVVEWFNAISSPFSWYRGVMASSSPSLLVPVYACIAGFIVIAVYRRFGR